MRSSLLSPFLLSASQLLLGTSYGVCAASSSLAPGNTTYPFTTIGNDNASDPATIDYMSNHISLIVRNLTASIDFYERAFGFRHLFTFQVSPSFSFTYMGHAAGGKNGTGYQTTEEIVREKNNRQGHIEFQFYNNPEAIAKLNPASGVVPNTVSHIGIVVPDLAAALKRFQDVGVRIVSKPGDVTTPGGELANAVGVGHMKADDPEAAGILEAFKALNSGLIFVTDPDGNMIEVQPQNESVQFG